MNGFDLNINNYSVTELEELLTLDKNYNLDEIKYKKDNICMKIADDDTISFDMKAKLEIFCENVSVILKNIVNKNKNGGRGGNNNDNNDNKVDKFSELKNDMMKNTNNLIISDPFAAHNIKVDPLRTNGLNVDSYGTQRGVINPLLTNTILKGVSIDTRFRDNYYSTKSTDLIINLPFRLENVISYRMVGITLPLTYYNISQSYGNNIIQINILNRTTGLLDVSYNLILPDGCYNTISQSSVVFCSSLEEVINNLLINDPNSPNNNISTPNLNIRYIIDRTSGRSIFAQDATVAGTIAYSFNIITNVVYELQSNTIETDNYRVLMMRLGWLLGFRVAQYSNSIPTIPVSTTDFGSIVSEGICLIKFPLYGFLAIDDFNKNSNDYYTSVFANSVSVPNIIGKINLTQFSEIVGTFQAAQGESSTNAINREKRFFGPVNIQKLKLTLYDDFGRILNLNNMDWSLELAFECAYNM